MVANEYAQFGQRNVLWYIGASRVVEPLLPESFRADSPPTTF
jgi:hypothetical protein